MIIASWCGTRLTPLVAGALVSLTGCRDARDPGLERGATVVMAVPDAGVLKPDAWDLDFLSFLLARDSQ